MKNFSLSDLKTGAVLVLVLFSIDQASSTTLQPLSALRSDASLSISNILDTSLRGGSKEVVKRRRSKAKKSLKRRKNSTQDLSRVSEERVVINAAIREKDAAVAMGDAIRERKDVLLQDELESMPTNHHVDPTMASLGYALGISGQGSPTSLKSPAQSICSDESGGVSPPTSAVIANYFLKSHGGMHGIQSLFSLLSTLFGLSALFLPVISSKVTWKMRVQLIHRCLLCALTKHLSSFLAVATISAARIPDIGWRDTRDKIESLALDPVAQYLFYCALLLLWVDGSHSAHSISSGLLAETEAPWYFKPNIIFFSTVCILGPILLREIVSTLWVLGDVLVLIQSTKSPMSPYHILKAARSIIDAIMSILLKPSIWRNTTSITQQKLLATLVGRTSLALEVGTCLVLVYDALRAFLVFSISSIEERGSLLDLSRRLLCTRLYINFMWVRRKKIRILFNQIRGGAVYIPERVFDTLMEPEKAMGIKSQEVGTEIKNNTNTSKVDGFNSWVDWSQLLIGFN